MNYFDDIEFIHVAKKICLQNSRDGLMPDNWWSIGLMLGSGFARKIISDTMPPIHLKMPFLYLGRPGDHTGWQNVNGKPRENRWFIMTGSRAERMVTALSELLNGESPAIYLDRYTELIVIHDRMLKLFEHNIPSQFYQLAMCAEEFAGTIYNLRNMKERSFPVYQVIKEIAEQICDHPDQSFDFKKIAKKNHLSYDYFRRCFQKFTGLPMRDFQQQKKLDHALKDLHNSSMSIKEISDFCGFPRQAEFARFIKKRTGLTPSEIQKQPIWDNGDNIASSR